MATVQRILVADATEQLAGIVRGALTLMDRHFILVEVPTADDALTELSNSQVDLLVAAYDLPDLNGMELGAKAIRESAGTPIIILADPDAPDVDEDTIRNLPYTYLVRPVGELFLRAIRIGLDGEAAVEAQESALGTVSVLDLGPVPELDMDFLRQQVGKMIQDTGAMGVFIADRLGRITYADELTSKNYFFDIQLCAANLAPQFARTIELRDLVHGNASALQHFDGDKYDLFALSIGLHFFAVMIFDGTKRPAFGVVTNFGRKIADGITESVGSEAWAYRRSAKTSTQTLKPVHFTDALEQTAASLPTDEAPTQPMTPAKSATEDFNLEPVEDLDVDALFNQKINESDFDALFSDDDLSNNIFNTDSSVSFEEAMDMGILDE